MSAVARAITTATTIAFAPSTAPRCGSAVKVERIMPVEYSPVTAIAPRMPATSIVNCIGMTIVITGASPPPKSREAEAIMSEIASDRATVTPSDHHVERRVSSLIHSLRTTRPNDNR